MKKLLLILAAVIGCSSMMLIDARCCFFGKKEKKCCPTKCEKKKCAKPCERSCATKCEKREPIACCSRIEKRCVQVPCKKIVQKQIPREVWTCHTEYDTICEEVVEYKTVEQQRQVCDYSETEWSCPSGDCCNSKCTHHKCKAYCANKANASNEGKIVPGSEKVAETKKGYIVDADGTRIPQTAHNVALEKETAAGELENKLADQVEATA